MKHLLTWPLEETIMKPNSNHFGGQMATNFTVKNIPQETFDKVKARAGRNRRSINGEIISILDAAVSPRPVNPDDMLARARELRSRTQGFLVDQAFLDEAKRKGRP